MDGLLDFSFNAHGFQVKDIDPFNVCHVTTLNAEFGDEDCKKQSISSFNASTLVDLEKKVVHT